MKPPKNIQTKIAEILRTIGSKDCIEKAALLENTENIYRSLHLRNLGLTPTDALHIAEALEESNARGDFILNSISFSNNPLLSDTGVINLLKSLPHTIPELGFVNCGMADIGGKALLNWMKNAPNLKMICAEQNNFSDKLKSNFKKFSVEHPQIIVVF